MMTLMGNTDEIQERNLELRLLMNYHWSLKRKHNERRKQRKLQQLKKELMILLLKRLWGMWTKKCKSWWPCLERSDLLRQKLSLHWIKENQDEKWKIRLKNLFKKFKRKKQRSRKKKLKWRKDFLKFKILKKD